MTKSTPPAHVQVNFRMPVDLRDRIRAAADSNVRSLTAEIVSALEDAYPAPEPEADDLTLALSAALMFSPDRAGDHLVGDYRLVLRYIRQIHGVDNAEGAVSDFGKNLSLVAEVPLTQLVGWLQEVFRPWAMQHARITEDRHPDDDC